MFLKKKLKWNMKIRTLELCGLSNLAVYAKAIRSLTPHIFQYTENIFF